MEEPRISVVVSAHGRSDYLPSALDSLASQTLPRTEFEVLVTSDGPAPPVAGALPLVWLTHPPDEPMGPMYAEAVARARGAIVAFLDDDDRFRAGKLAAVAEAFEADPTLGYFHHWFQPTDQTGRPLTPERHRPEEGRHRRSVGALTFSGRAALRELRRHPALGIDFCNSCLSVRRSVLWRHLAALRDPRIYTLDTFAFFASLAEGASLRIDPRPLTEYRLHDRNTSAPITPTEAARHFQRIDESYRAIRELAVRTGDPELLREADALVLLHRIDVAFQHRETSRLRYLALARASRSLRGTYLWNARTQRLRHYGLTALLVASAIAPSFGVTAHRWLPPRTPEELPDGPPR